MLLPMLGACAIGHADADPPQGSPISDSLRERTVTRERAHLEQAARAARATKEV